uniref:Uncharacterized protein n=1 Tax=Pararge aegeria TaxID=116150 RepID=S4NVZ8_9NEOP
MIFVPQKHNSKKIHFTQIFKYFHTRKRLLDCELANLVLRLLGLAFLVIHHNQDTILYAVKDAGCALKPRFGLALIKDNLGHAFFLLNVKSAIF